MFEMKVISKEQQQISAWSGGTTTQVSIYPKDSNYLNRDFMWRLSTAVVEIEESTFTKLPGFDRHLMVLEGKLELIHKEHHNVLLKQYEQDSFKGEWDTVSYGKARDFNLMLKEGIKGRLEHSRISVGQAAVVDLEVVNKKQGFIGCYCYKGLACFESGETKAQVDEGELLLISYDDYLKLNIKNIGTIECNMIIAFIEV